PDASPASDLAAAAKQTKHPVLHALYRDLSYPHDVATYRSISAIRPPRVEFIEPLRNYYGGAPDFRGSLAIQPLNREDWKKLAKSEITKNSVDKIEPYESLALTALRRLEEAQYGKLDESDRKYLSKTQLLQAEETVLSAVLRFHDAARESNVREGDGWDTVATSLKA